MEVACDSGPVVPPDSFGMSTWHGFLQPVLDVLSDGKIWKTRNLQKAVCDRAGLSESQRVETLPSGQSRAENRIGWATSALYKAELIEKPDRGAYMLSGAGHKFRLDHANETISEKTLKTIPAYQKYLAAIARAQSQPKSPIPDESGADPLESIENGIATLHSEVETELLKRLRDQDPDFLERSVLDVLVAMGYGGAEQRAAVIGGSGDGGLDGVIDQDPLGLERVYVQAKRYKEGSAVGRPDIQGFVGALHGKGANRGVFITTSSFTADAREYVRTVPTRVILIDGQRLAQLMIKYGIGVQQRQVFTVVELDEDYFD